MIKSIEIKITRTEVHTKMSERSMSSGQGESVISITDFSVTQRPENTQSNWSNNSTSNRDLKAGKALKCSDVI